MGSGGEICKSRFSGPRNLWELPGVSLLCLSPHLLVVASVCSPCRKRGPGDTAPPWARAEEKTPRAGEESKPVLLGVSDELVDAGEIAGAV